MPKDRQTRQGLHSSSKALCGAFIDRELKRKFEHIAVARNLTVTDLLTEAVLLTVNEYAHLLDKPVRKYIEEQLEALLQRAATESPWVASLSQKGPKTNRARVVARRA